jgi:membrane protease YdiL (CAAX protease family)
MVLIVYLLVRRAGSDWSAVTTRPLSASPDAARRTKRLLGFELPWTVWCVLGGLAACYGVLYTFSAIVQIFGFDWLVPGEQIPDEYFDNTWLVIAIGIAVVITAPIAEEVFFRGFMFGGLRRTLPLWPAALISGVIFAIPHLDVGLMIPFTFIGAILANTYHASGRLAASITVHFIFNLVSFVLLVFVPEIRE